MLADKIINAEKKMNVICDQICEKQPGSKKKKVLLLYLLRRTNMPSSKFEANSMHHLCSFSLFPLAFSWSNDYFCTYAIIDFLANRLVFANMVTHVLKCA